MALSSDRNLLFGIVALQMDFITRDALIAAMNAWVLDKERTLGELLEEQGALAAGDRALLEPLVNRHIEQHSGDAAQSLASLSSVEWIRHGLVAHGPADAEFQLSLNRLPSPGVEFDPHATAPHVGEAGPTGARFRILKFHARGGLGEVFVAEDAELHREVALKQIQDRHASHSESRSRFLLEAEITGGLEHPGIVPVYGLGHNDEGRPFYAMRFIKGDSLREAIARFHDRTAGVPISGERMLALQKLLRRFLDVCNAIGYAHSRGVLHRDIKPGNIMVGQYGETLVVDWGLAKVVGTREGGSEGTLRPPSASGSSETLPGSAIGTPAFMSPEQAAGRLDELGPRSDVYSLGATLYCLLTGRSPIDGAGLDIDRILDRVQRGEIPAPRHVDPGVPRALEAICMKAMALRAPDRYASPGALADDVERWLADEPVTAWHEPLPVRARRWILRHRTAVAAACSTVVVALGALGLAYRHEMSVNARLARANAELLQANAREQTARAESDRRLDETLQAIEDYYTGVGQEVLLDQQEFRQLRARLLEKPRQFYEKLARELAEADPDDVRSRALLANGRLKLGTILHDLGRFSDARPQFEAGTDLFIELAQKRPDEAAYRMGLAGGYNKLGLVLEHLGNRTEAARSMEKAIATLEPIVSAGQLLPRSSYNLALSQNNLGFLHTRAGDGKNGRKHQERAISAETKLMSDYPDAPEYAILLAKSYTGLSEALGRTGDFNDAADVIKKAVTIETKLVARYPDVPDYQDMLGNSQINLGNALRHSGFSQEVTDAYRQAADTLAALVAKHPNVAKHKRGLASTYQNLGDQYRITGNPLRAHETLEKAIATWNDLVAANPGVPDYQDQLAGTYLNLGYLMEATRRPGEALRLHRKGVSILTKVVTENPNVARYQNTLALGYTHIGICCGDLRDLPGAADAFRRVVELRERLVAAHPENPDFRYHLALAHSNAGLGLYRMNGADPAAGKAYDRALDIGSKLIRDYPESAIYHNAYASALSNQGVFLRLLGQCDQAIAAIKLSIEHQRIAIGRDPGTEYYKRGLIGHLADLAYTLRTCGRVQEAVDTLRQRRALGLSGAVEQYNDACMFALCVPQIHDGARKHEVAGEAIVGLRAAIASGWKDAALTSRDPDLAPLHDRDDFRRIVADLWDRGFPADPFLR